MWDYIYKYRSIEPMVMSERDKLTKKRRNSTPFDDRRPHVRTHIVMMLPINATIAVIVYTCIK